MSQTEKYMDVKMKIFTNIIKRYAILLLNQTFQDCTV